MEAPQIRLALPGELGEHQAMPRKEHDLNTATAEALARMTGTTVPRGEDLTDDPALKAKYLAAIAKEKAREKRSK
jgi:hypothetical protein